MSETRVVATVLNFDNPWGVRHVLECLAAQTRPPDRIVVVDNGGSTPLEPTDPCFVHVDLVRSQSNLGVGGGHNLAIRRALEVHGADLVWVLEHDTFPDTTCLAGLLRRREESPSDCVVATTLTRNNYERRALAGSSGRDEIDRVTLNGPLISRSVLSAVGLLNEDLFVGHEDWEYSRRLSAAGVPMLRAADAVAIHAHKGVGRFRAYVSPSRVYYSTRNAIVLNEDGRARLIARAAAAALVELARPGRGWVFAAARARALLDGVRHRLGPRSYRFMRRA